jgi:hypothetical protein
MLRAIWLICFGEWVCATVLLDFIERRLAQFLARKNLEEQVYGGLKVKSELR